MKKLIAITALIAPMLTEAQEIEIRHDRYLATGRVTWAGNMLGDAQGIMAWEAMQRCPSGFEIKRLYAAPDAEGEWKAGMTVVCLPPGAIPAMPEKPRTE